MASKPRLERFLRLSGLSSDNAALTPHPVAAYKAVDENEYLSARSALRQPSAIRALMPLLALPGMVSLGGGLPNPAMFPFKGFSFSLPSGETFSLSPQEVSKALQYSPTPGLPQLVEQVRALQKREHLVLDTRPDDEWAVSVTTGSQDALGKAFNMLLQEGDSVLVEAPTYSGALAALRPMGVNMIELKTDHEGLIPSSLEAAMKGPFRGKKPRVLYTIVTGQNPSGATLTNERKTRIYSIACRHDLIVLEDDPYRYLEYGMKAAPAEDASFKRPENRSMFSMDTQGRVLRFDSLSKVLSSGLRLGMVTGPTGFVRRLDLESQASTLHTSGLSQMVVAKLLEIWGPEGWNTHCDAVSLFYARRRDIFLSLCEKYLTGLATWVAPTAGMFVWFTLNDGADSKLLIQERAIEAKVILMHGQAFMPSNSRSSCVRASFSTATDEQMETALQRFSSLLRK